MDHRGSVVIDRWVRLDLLQDVHDLLLLIERDLDLTLVVKELQA